MAARYGTKKALSPASGSDSRALLPALTGTQARELGPQEVLADTAYGSDDNCGQAAALEVEMVAPLPGLPPAPGLSLADFQLPPEGRVRACPLVRRRGSVTTASTVTASHFRPHGAPPVPKAPAARCSRGSNTITGATLSRRGGWRRGGPAGRAPSFATATVGGPAWRAPCPDMTAAPGSSAAGPGA